MTQESVARRAQVSVRTMRNAESPGAGPPRWDTVVRLAGALGLADEERLRLEGAGLPPDDGVGHRLVIGVVGPDSAVLDDPFVGRVTAEVARVCGPEGVGVSLQWLPVRDAGALGRLGEDRGVRGLLLVNTTSDTLSALPARLRRRTCSIGCGAPDVASFTVDNESGFDGLVGHLHSAGRRAVVMMAMPRWLGCAGPVLAYRRRTAGAGLPVRVVAGGFGVADGRRAAGEILRRWPATDAVVACSDATAVGVLAGLRQRGVQVPGDVAVTGFDDAPLVAATATPALTTSTYPAGDIARDAARYLLRVPAADPAATSYPSRLVVRHTT